MVGSAVSDHTYNPSGWPGAPAMALVTARVGIAKPSKWVDSFSGSDRAHRIKSLNMESGFEDSMQIGASGWLVVRWEGLTAASHDQIGT